MDGLARGPAGQVINSRHRDNSSGAGVNPQPQITEIGTFDKGGVRQAARPTEADKGMALIKVAIQLIKLRFGYRVVPVAIQGS